MNKENSITNPGQPYFQIRSFLENNASILLIYGLIIGLSIVTALISEDYRKIENIFNILRQSIVLGLFVIGQIAVLLTGGLDISQDMVARLVGLVVATIFAAHDGSNALILPLVLLAMLIGLVVGALNGIIITRTHGVSFIVTFGTAFILRGINLAISRTPIRGVPVDYTNLYYAQIGKLPINIILMVLVWILAWLFFSRTETGRNLYAVGGSQESARLAGISINKTVIIAYMISAGFAAAAGLFLLSRMGVGDPSAAEGMAFKSIVACAVGSISLYGGKGSIIGAIGGTFLIILLSNIFNILQINVYFQHLLLGITVLIAVAAYKLRRTL